MQPVAHPVAEAVRYPFLKVSPFDPCHFPEMSKPFRSTRFSNEHAPVEPMSVYPGGRACGAGAGVRAASVGAFVTNHGAGSDSDSGSVDAGAGVGGADTDAGSVGDEITSHDGTGAGGAVVSAGVGATLTIAAAGGGGSAGSSINGASETFVQHEAFLLFFTEVNSWLCCSHQPLLPLIL